VARPVLQPVAVVVAGRLARTALVLLGAATLVFLVVRLVPGDPAVSILGDQASPEQLAALRERMGLDLPLGEQYGRFLSEIADGSLGTPLGSASPGVTVRSRILDVLPFTIELALTAVLVASLIALPLGILAALRRRSLADSLSLAATLVGLAMPTFWLGPLLIYLLCVHWPLLPDPASGVTGWTSLVLPACILGLALSARLTRMVRSSVLDVLREPYVAAAYARGLPHLRVIVRHVLRNALVPVVTVLGLQFAALLSGALVTEKVFARPGIGTLLIDAVARRDYALVQGTTLFIGVVYVLVNLCVDVAYLFVDPRIARGSRREGA